MYQLNSVKKAVHQLQDATSAYRAQIRKEGADAVKMCISYGNRKIGRAMNVSNAPVITCGNCSGCMFYCYDIKAVLQYRNVVDARARNTALLLENRDEYFRRIDDAISRRRKNKFFRWHVSGDILDADYLARMVDMARAHPDFTFWTYTKRYDIVNEYCQRRGGRSAIPGNLSIMFSEWRGMPMVNPYHFPEFSVIFKDDEHKPAGHYCPGNCDVCKANHRGCIAGETTYCHEH